MTTPFNIDGLLSHVDFERIQKVMVALDWKYRGQPEPPTQRELSKMAEEVLKSLEQRPDCDTVASGGFRAWREEDVYGIEFLIDDVDSTWLEEELDPAHEQSEAT